ncbi:Homeobox domain [Macleaya cordata]|uniref:Homeobox domain n=2 Tax=Magnoliopsida TaxID=3398 RepID=A0A200R6R7_MACCD|nr:Homeobox domain [Macleaya cordata]
MGRPPHSGVGPAFRFTSNEVAEMEACLQEASHTVPSREVLCSLAEKFSASAERSGKIVVQPKQVWNWFQNRRYAQKAKLIKSPGKLSVTPMAREDLVSIRNVPHSMLVPSASQNAGRDNNALMEFEAKSSRDGAWYDVASFVSHRMFETGDPEVRVRFSGFGAEEDEWVNVRKHVRQRSLPCEASECVAVLAGDLILCFQEGKDQALYFDAHVLDAQRRRHDVRGCRCRFLVRYDHDQAEEIVPLRKVCRRPETDYRLQLLHASKEFVPLDLRDMGKDACAISAPKSVSSEAEKSQKVEANADEAKKPVSAETVVAAPEKKVETSNCNENIGTPNTRTVGDATLGIGTTNTNTDAVTGSGTSDNMEEGK